ncbi:10181_t:CDS:2, partial [Acaulospora colombiana]
TMKKWLLGWERQNRPARWKPSSVPGHEAARSFPKEKISHLALTNDSNSARSTARNMWTGCPYYTSRSSRTRSVEDVGNRDKQAFLIAHYVHPMSSTTGDGPMSSRPMNQQFDEPNLSSGLNMQHSEVPLHHDDEKVKSGAPSPFGSGDAIADPTVETTAAPTAEQPFPDEPPTTTNETHGKKNASSDNEMPNIETTPVEDDPRQWSARRKLVILGIISFAALAPTTGAFIYQPAIQAIEKDLHATTSEIALSLSLFILVQGNAPLIWSSLSEIKGRKFVYIASMLVFIVGSAIGGASKHIVVLICMRMLQAAGSAAVLAIGAGTLAERGTMMGIYYAAPLLGPSLGPLL